MPNKNRTYLKSIEEWTQAIENGQRIVDTDDIRLRVKDSTTG